MNRKNIPIVIGLILLLSFLLYIQLKDELDIKKNKEATKGKIIRLSRQYRASYGLVYEYYVDGKRYTGQAGISPFYCDDGTKYCMGKEFTVYYSSKSHSNSNIDLGKYEKYKTAIEFVK